MSDHRSVLSKYPEYEVVIGVEVHVQSTTKTKIFCACPNVITQEPNTNICQVCTGQPGVLPTLNERVIEYAVKAGLATHSTIAPRSIFDRKHYFYPDLPKGYQITQQYEPICTNGHVPVRCEDGSLKKIRLNRIHIEEDAGKNIHAAGADVSFVDLNRAGTPLLEIVSYPDISSVVELRNYLKSLRATVQYLGICTGNMEDGAFRADTNISVRKKGQKELGTKCELKNINSFKFICDATEYEIERQITVLEDGGTIKQETRLWDTKNHKTIVMRTKEGAADYRFLQDPDLPYVSVDQSFIDQIRDTLPELPNQKFERLLKSGLSEYEAEILIDEPEVAQYFEQAHTYTKSKLLINWILRDLLGYTKQEKISLAECKVTPERLAQLVDLLESGVINNHAAQEVFLAVAQTGVEPKTVVKERNLEQLSSTDELEAIIKDIIAANMPLVEQYRSGKEKMFGFFVGQVMQKTKGKANPTIVTPLLKKYLSQ